MLRQNCDMLGLISLAAIDGKNFQKFDSHHRIGDVSAILHDCPLSAGTCINNRHEQ